MMRTSLRAVIFLFCSLPTSLFADTVYNQDTIVKGHLCSGYGCMNGERFTNTLKLKNNNNKIDFYDTSHVKGFPPYDWMIQFNDISNGGANYFSILDATSSTVPFKTIAGAPNNSLYINSQGNIGLGTSNPQGKLHIKSSNTPYIRLETNASLGWAPYYWDLGKNEANAFIRTQENTLPFDIRSGAPTNSLTLGGYSRTRPSSAGVGIGTASPEYMLDIVSNSASINIGFNGVATSNTTLLELVKPQGSFLNVNNTVENWSIGLDNNEVLMFTEEATSSSPLFRLDTTGNLTITGYLNQNVGAVGNVKQGDLVTDKQAILNKALSLNISHWQYRDDIRETPHIGPMAEEFHQLMSLGDSSRFISLLDLSSFTTVALQGLVDRLNEKQKDISRIEEKLKNVKTAYNEREQKILILAQAVARLELSNIELSNREMRNKNAAALIATNRATDKSIDRKIDKVTDGKGGVQ